MSRHTPYSDFNITDKAKYAAKQSPNGPGMTFAIFSIAASAVDPSGCSAFTYDENSWSPYLRAPWFSFSEQLVDDPLINGNTNPAFPFLTGHGGFLQVDVFGYLGLRREIDYFLRVKPSLPPQIQHIAYPTIFHFGWPVDAVSNKTHTTLTRSGKALSTANKIFANRPITVVVDEAKYQLFADSTVTIVNSLYAENETEENNILQCNTVTSLAPTQPGLFPNGAIDGTPSTSWQPSDASIANTLTVDISSTPFQQLDHLSFDWGSQPPKKATVLLHNHSDPTTSSQKIVIDDIKISLPFNAANVATIEAPKGNTTTYNFTDASWSGNFVSLIVEGNQFNETKGAAGATIAEFALVGKR